MRILLVSHPPLTAELGAAQIALSLAEALRGRGHDARAWSPEPLPPGRWWSLWRRQQKAVEDFAAREGPFDVIDTPALTATRVVARSARALVVRSIQPELLYLAEEVRGHLLHTLASRPKAAAIRAGWRHARLILCLGSLERAWMSRRFPRWAAKLGLYVCAPAPADQAALAAVRAERKAPAGGGLRFLWLGRWASHKGTARLLRFLGERVAACPEDTFTLAGCGPAAERDLPAGWLRSGTVRLVPSYRREELPALLASHDAGLFTSDVEGWALTLNEMLESGLPVYATEAGAVPDLRPYFPQSLRPFPPPGRPEAAPLENLSANGYFERFNWPAIAHEYERQAEGALE